MGWCAQNGPPKNNNNGSLAREVTIAQSSQNPYAYSGAEGERGEMIDLPIQREIRRHYKQCTEDW